MRNDETQEEKYMKNKWTSIEYVPSEIPAPRSGIFGGILDFLFGVKRRKNENPLAGRFVAVDGDGHTLTSEDGVEWGR